MKQSVIRNLSSVCWPLALVGLSACAVGPDYTKPVVAQDVAGDAARWETAYEPAVARQSEAANEVAASAQREWWLAFHDPALTALIQVARAQNLDVKHAVERIREARAYVDAANAALLPEVMVSGGARRSGVSSGVSPSSVYEAGFDAAWELDVFGGLRRQSEAQVADWESVVAQRDDVELSLVSEVAKHYVDFRRAQYEHQLALRTLRAQEKTARITEVRYQQGVDGRLEFERAQVALANTQLRVPAAKAAAQAARFQLAFLLAQAPTVIDDILMQHTAAETHDTLQVPLLDSLLILPADVLGYRPDVRAAERQLAAATARQGVAVAARYPRLTLGGLLGLSADNGDGLFKGQSRVWAINANALMPIIDFGRRRADIEAADAQQAQALLNYERSVRNAITEINTALNHYVRQREQLVIAQQAVDAAKNAVIIATKQYQEGVLPQLEVLLAERALFDAEWNEKQTRAAVAEQFIALNKALGRGLNERNSL